MIAFSIQEGPTEEKFEALGVIMWLFVSSEYRQKGVGNALMEEFYNVLNQVNITEERILI